jgi:hypothetical protein
VSKLLPPAPDALYGEGGSVGVNTDTDPAMVGGDVVDAVRRRFAKFRGLEVMHPHFLGLALRP